MPPSGPRPLISRCQRPAHAPIWAEATHLQMPAPCSCPHLGRGHSSPDASALLMPPSGPRPLISRCQRPAHAPIWAEAAHLQMPAPCSCPHLGRGRPSPDASALLMPPSGPRPPISRCQRPAHAPIWAKAAHLQMPAPCSCPHLGRGHSSPDASALLMPPIWAEATHLQMPAPCSCPTSGPRPPISRCQCPAHAPIWAKATHLQMPVPCSCPHLGRGRPSPDASTLLMPPVWAEASHLNASTLLVPPGLSRTSAALSCPHRQRQELVTPAGQCPAASV
ncbi:hypothetical protein P7K49_009111 [Saguinus oedipus]|uniref:Uncharacterized protein n=1 Tax=Saguinus oedipus TaxID=9490 RepID=A0ABQ9VZN0_SAGOE|nr:hypothetical protein P7K49_009111 [Saguinus oedipus]